MKESERSAFEEQWKGAFERAEVSPASSVWSNLDRKLTLAEGNEMKKRMVFYQRLAAASVLFALLMGSFSVYHWRESEKQIAQLNSNAKLNETLTDKRSNSNGNAVTENEKGKNDVASENKIGGTKKQNQSANRDESSQTLINSDDDSFVTQQQMALTNDGLNKANNQPESASNLVQNKTKLDWYTANLDTDLPLLPGDSVQGKPTFKDYIRKLPAIPGAFMSERKPSKIEHEKLWASVVGSSGTYTENNSRSAYAVTSAQLNNSNGSSSVTGNSYTVGMLGGVRVARRWVVQSGVQYMNQSANYSSNISTGTLNSVANYAYDPSKVSLAVAGSSSYDIISTNQFVTVPVQAGYLLIDKKLGWQVNPGVATDFFVRNTLSDPSGQRQSYSQGAGSDSPYRSVNFSGLMSSEVSYKLGKNYRVSLVPGFRYFFNPILKSQTTGNPFVWDLGFRFRYIFK